MGNSGDRFVEVKGARLWCTESGDGVPLVLFNGGPGCDDYLLPVAEMIEDRCRVIRFEPRGCGRSTWDGRYDLDTLVDDVERLRDAFGVDRWIVAGHSMGPNLALAYTLAHPDRVIGLIGIAGGSIVNDRDWSEAYHKGLATLGEESGSIEFHADATVNPAMNASWRTYIKEPDLLRKIAELRLPAAFITAGDDIRPAWPTLQLAALLPRGAHVEVPGASHYIWLTHARELREQLDRALRRILAG